MTGKLFIDGFDAYTTFGAFVTKGGMNSLLDYPSIKSVVSNDWQERDGIEPDLSELHFNKKELQISLAFNGGKAKINALYAQLKSKPYHTLNFASIGITRSLRLIGMPSVDYAEKLSFATLRFCDDVSPLEGRTFTTFGTKLIAEDTSVLLDNVPLTKYGVRVLKGTRNTIFKKSNLKQMLERNISNSDGVEYDSAEIGMKESNGQITLNCLLVGATTAEAWNNYFGLLSALVKKDTSHLVTEECLRTVVYAPLGETIKCYYSNGSVSNFRVDNGRVWLEFTITLVKV